MIPELTAVLLKHNLRITKPRLAVFKTLQAAESPKSITEIIAACPSIDKVSVYRTIDLFSRVGVTVAVARGWKQFYELASPFAPHHHHLLCTRCQRLIEIHSHKLESIIGELADEYRFTPITHHFELEGLCSDCG